MAQGRKTGGRNKGTPNKLSSTVRAIELMAAAEVFGSGSKEKAFIVLYRWAWKALNDKRLAPDTKQKIWQTLVERLGGKLPQPLKADGDEQEPVILNVHLHKDAPPA